MCVRGQDDSANPVEKERERERESEEETEKKEE
jgi:hypothetical protein